MKQKGIKRKLFFLKLTFKGLQFTRLRLSKLSNGKNGLSWKMKNGEGELISI